MRLEKKKHLEAELRLRDAILQGRTYPGKQEDLELVRRKRREGRELIVGRGGGGLLE